MQDQVRLKVLRPVLAAVWHQVGIVCIAKVSFPRRREPSKVDLGWKPAFAGKTI